MQDNISNSRSSDIEGEGAKVASSSEDGMQQDESSPEPVALEGGDGSNDRSAQKDTEKLKDFHALKSLANSLDDEDRRSKEAAAKLRCNRILHQDASRSQNTKTRGKNFPDEKFRSSQQQRSVVTPVATPKETKSFPNEKFGVARSTTRDAPHNHHLQLAGAYHAAAEHAAPLVPAESSGNRNRGQEKLAKLEAYTGRRRENEEQQVPVGNEPPSSPFFPAGDDSAPAQEGQDEGTPSSLRGSAITSGNGLTEAMPVEDVNLPDMEAQPYDVEAANRKKIEETKQQQKHCLLLVFAFICIVVGVIIGVKLNSNNQETLSSPTHSPSMAPSDSPSSAGAAALEVLREGLHQYTLANLVKYGTPQWKAMDWVSRHPELPGMEENRMRQLFALATFYYSMDGDNWPEEMKERWLQGTDECYWFSGWYGYITEDGTYTTTESVQQRYEISHLEAFSYDDLGLEGPCNEENQFQAISLSFLGSSQEKRVLPREISLLTSISVLWLTSNDLNASLDEFILPETYHDLATLDSLFLGANSLFGTIPPQMGEMSAMSSLALDRNDLSGTIPTELCLMSNLTWFFLWGNKLGGSIPSEVGHLTKISFLPLNTNALTGQIPSELGVMTSMSMLVLYANLLTGRIPSELGGLTSLVYLHLSLNALTGQLPTELGMITSLASFLAQGNHLSGPIPSQIGRMTALKELGFQMNNLTGSVPPEIALLTNMTHLALANNNLSGSLPPQFALMTNLELVYLQNNMLTGSLPSQLASFANLEQLLLENNYLTGSIPVELEALRVNGSIKALALANNSFYGTIPEGLCSLGVFDPISTLGLSFNCNDQLCGCCWCPCPDSNYSGECETRPFIPSRDDQEWPGSFPSPVNRSNTIEINVRSNDHPHFYGFEWSHRTGPGTWEPVEEEDLENVNTLHSYTYEVESHEIYSLHLFDKFGIGVPMCCVYGFGWFTITNAIPSEDHPEGTVVWEASGDELVLSLEVFIWVDQYGHAHQVEYLPGEGYALIDDDGADEKQIIVVSKASNQNLTGLVTDSP